MRSVFPALAGIPLFAGLLLLLLVLPVCSAFDLDAYILPKYIGEEYDLSTPYPRRSSKGLQEFTPISNTIGQSELQYYSFNVNASTGLGEYYQYLVFLTGNICDLTADAAAAANQSLTVYYSFNLLMFQNLEVGQMTHFEYGYFQALTDIAILDSLGQSVLYIAVRAPQSTNTSATWSYEIGVSQNDLVFQYDDHSFAEVVDTDHESALIVTGNLTSREDTDASNFNASLSMYQLYVYAYSYRDYFDNSNSSWCAIRNGPALFTSANLVTSYTTRGGGLSQEFLVKGLNASTKYVGYLVSNFGGSNFGGAVYKQFQFETMASDTCALVYNLDFCDQVAYLVPKLSLPEYQDNDALKQLYDDRAKAIYQNFSKALDQIACNTTDDAIFSPVRSCADCQLLYKDWLCSVTIPRCSTRNITGYIQRTENNSRNAFIDDIVVPPLDYFEVLPCVNVCQAVVRDCPADFGFVCPKHNDSIRLSYFWDTGGEYALCNYVGIKDTEENAATMKHVGWLVLVVSVVVTMVC